MADDPIITMDDVRQAGICVLGQRGWFRSRGLDFRKFIAEGLPASVMLGDPPDAMVQRVIERMRERAHG